MPTSHTVERYDILSVLLHWSIAVFTIALFASGLWMVELGYYDNWYYEAPWWHKGIGVITAVLVVVRWLWLCLRQSPPALPSIPHWQRIVARVVHQLMNIAIILLFVSGYFMVTAKGDPLVVFNWFSLPAITSGKSGWSDIAGTLHLALAWFIISIAALHALAALKHHFVDKDATLKRILAIREGEH